MAESVRLQRFLAAAGVAARRKAEQMITAGRVTVNGAVVNVLGTKVDPEHDSVTVDGEAVSALDHFYVLLNKPKGCITAVTDDRGRPTVMDYLPNVPFPVKPVGRLDFYTEGVLLLTNDGELAARLLAPASHVQKTYHAKVHGRVTPDDVKLLRKGVQLEDGTITQPADVALLPSESKHSWVAITIHEGKHHQIHRMIEALGFRVDKLQRVAFANLTFHGLRVGDARELTQQELNELRDAVHLDHSAVARGRWRASREATDIPRRARAKVRAEAEDAAALPAAVGGATSVRDTGSDGDEWSPDPDVADDGPDDAPPSRATSHPARGGAARDTGSRNPRSTSYASRGTSYESRGTRYDSSGASYGGPSREARGPSRDARGSGPSRDARRSGPSRDARGSGPSRDARGSGPSRDARGSGPSRDARGPSRDARGPSRDARGSSRDARGPSRDARGPSRDARGPSRDARGSSRDARGPRGGSRTEASPSEDRGAPSGRVTSKGQGRSFGKRAGPRRPR